MSLTLVAVGAGFAQGTEAPVLTRCGGYTAGSLRALVTVARSRQFITNQTLPRFRAVTTNANKKYKKILV